MPEGFQFLDQEVDLWTACRLDRGRDWRATAGRFINVVARRKTGVSVEAARAEMEGLAGRLAAAHAFNKDTTVADVPAASGADRTGAGLALDALRRRRRAVVDRLLQRRQSAARARRDTPARAGDPHIARRGPRRDRAAADRRERAARHRRRRARRLAGARQPRRARRLRAAGSAAGRRRSTVDLRVLLYTLGLSMATGLIVGLVPALLVAREPLLASMRASSCTRDACAAHPAGARHRPVRADGDAALRRRTARAHDAGAERRRDRRQVARRADDGGRWCRGRDIRRSAASQFYREAVDALRALPGVDAAAAANSLAVSAVYAAAPASIGSASRSGRCKNCK